MVSSLLAGSPHRRGSSQSMLLCHSNRIDATIHRYKCQPSSLSFSSWGRGTIRKIYRTYIRIARTNLGALILRITLVRGRRMLEGHCTAHFSATSPLLVSQVRFNVKMAGRIRKGGSIFARHLMCCSCSSCKSGSLRQDLLPYLGDTHPRTDCSAAPGLYIFNDWGRANHQTR